MQLFITKRMKKNNAQGFTLVETLVAVTILLVVIVGPMRIAQKGMQSAYYAGEQTTATYLAQEAIEYILYLRDNNALQNFQDWNSEGNDNDGNTWSWYASIPAACKGESGSGCDIDIKQGTFHACSTQTACVLNTYDKESNPPTSAKRLFGYTETGSTWGPSIFTRTIRLGTPTETTFNNGSTPQGGVPVTVTVSWTASILGGATKSVVIQTFVYDIYSKYE